MAAACAQSMTGALSPLRGLALESAQGGVLWEEPTSKADSKSLLRAVRVVRQTAKKRTASLGRLEAYLCGASSRTVSLILVLKKNPERKRRLQISLPYPVSDGQPAEGICMKIAGQRRLIVQIGWCSMDEDCLVKNATTAVSFIKRTIGHSLVQEIRIQGDGLFIPVWDAKVERHRQKGHKRTAAAMTCLMLPPATPAAKRARCTAEPEQAVT
eukprot:TRINITY_DN72679_c0_g1_i1.p1 TRINITY_DN72679_c0_g1~~TRINITY_DN72679_c0_g1_i1.p1  ORF type:complete len:213 (+),score=39.61 TRINITY_DN72679_c0_g1_i1:138-776(+)